MALPKKCILNSMKNETKLQVSDLAVDEMKRFLEALLIWLTRQASMRANIANRKRISPYDVFMAEKTLVSSIEGLV